LSTTVSGQAGIPRSSQRGTPKLSSLPKKTALCLHSFVLIRGIARKNALSLEHRGFFGGYSAD